MDLRKFKRKLNKIKTKRPTNKFWLLACEVSKITKSTPARWVRECKNNEWGIVRTINDLKDLKPKNKASYFTWLYYNKYRKVIPT